MGTYLLEANQLEKDTGLVAGEGYVFALALATEASAGQTIQFQGTFVDPTGSPVSVTEPWDIVFDPKLDTARMARFGNSKNQNYITENATIALIFSVLWLRSGLLYDKVIEIDDGGGDYLVKDAKGTVAGCIEVSGIAGRYVSSITSTKRRQVSKSVFKPQRIGVVAFGGLELWIERLP